MQTETMKWNSSQILFPNPLNTTLSLSKKKHQALQYLELL